ncbi:MAG: hypothetical protein AVDCRST_MAG66-966 [uncultured Pseudonocardia sp.]|uniref:Uncharacterized protein n=1 Tax=uncultured Pseudonocardia sp. TaxID=211455 RepID=A0A6J4NUK9_9PSEU|nr:MAG: hypothetical protein AVDCRST_MAG66-966 [uncultured Pseudonocardia sp.]
MRARATVEVRGACGCPSRGDQAGDRAPARRPTSVDRGRPRTSGRSWRRAVRGMRALVLVLVPFRVCGSCEGSGPSGDI